MEYSFGDIEKKWKQYWNEQKVYKVENPAPGTIPKPKCYVLDMFPYPSGAGLHVGHPLGYIASDIYARYKRMNGFNVLHPMGFDAFGLPAEQYALETGQHPALTTEKNIARYREQLDNIGFCYDWDREVRTSDPKYYKWTQWIFLQLFHSWYDRHESKARPITELVAIFEKEGNTNQPCPGDEKLSFDPTEWADFSEKEQRDVLMKYRLAYQGYAQVWWCEALGTVLANDEVVNGVSERGGHPVERKNMRQWFLRITEYAERLLQSLDTLDWSEAMKEMQRNWIGKSNGAEVTFGIRVRGLTPTLSKGEGAVSQHAGGLTPTLSKGEGAISQHAGGLTPALSIGEGAVSQIYQNNDGPNDTLSLGEGRGEATGNDGNFSINSNELNYGPNNTLSLGEGRGEATGNDGLNASIEEDIANPISWQTSNRAVYHKLIIRQKELKNKLTETENIIWQKVRNNQLGVRFRRQHIIDHYIVDFICLSKNLIIEIDGSIHENKKESNEERTKQLESLGFKVIRFSNEEILSSTKAVVEKIKKYLDNNSSLSKPDEGISQHKGGLTPTLSKGEGAISHNNNNKNNDGPNDTLSLGEGRGEARGNDGNFGNNSNEPNDGPHNTLSPGEGRGEARGNDGNFGINSNELKYIKVFTTRPDTIFGVDFLVLAPEHEYVDYITTPAQRQAIDEYRHYVKSRSERERMSEVKQVTGCFTGSYAIHPLTEKELPVWISEYVLVNYGTGAIMAVPGGDDRDHAFAKHFGIPITNIFGDKYTGEAAYSAKTGTIENSYFLSGLNIAEATEAAINVLEDEGVGERKVNYKLRDAGFSRQRYWGEPFPIIYVDDIPYGNDEHIISYDPKLGHLPVELPMVESYKPGPEGQGPLANLEDWVNTPVGQRETNTMPGYAGSSWYFLRYMDPHNDTEFAGRSATDYWQQVDLYIGGNEHAVGHLLYSRLWTKALYDLGHIGFDEPFKKMLNQGMIQGSSRFAGKIKVNLHTIPDHGVASNVFISFDLLKKLLQNKLDFTLEDLIFKTRNIGPYRNYYESWHIDPVRVDVNIVEGTVLDIDAFKKWRTEYANAEFISEDDGKFICSTEIEKMSKSKYNVVNPDDIVAQYGADTFRMYEMFLGPIDVSKPWDTKGIEGVHRFLKKMWRLYFDEQKGLIVNNDAPTEAEMRILHKTIKKVGEDIERFSFNTSVSQFMICVNELAALGCHKRAVLEPLALAICPFAPHISEEFWHQLGHSGTVIHAEFPKFEERYVTENTKKYPIAVNGKPRNEMEFPLDTDPNFVEQTVLADETVQKWMEGKPLKKFIYVKGKMINVVV